MLPRVFSHKPAQRQGEKGKIKLSSFNQQQTKRTPNLFVLDELNSAHSTQFNGTTHVWNAGETLVVISPGQILKRWAELFNKILNCSYTMSASALDKNYLRTKESCQANVKRQKSGCRWYSG